MKGSVAMCSAFAGLAPDGRRRAVGVLSAAQLFVALVLVAAPGLAAATSPGDKGLELRPTWRAALPNQASGEIAVDGAGSTYVLSGDTLEVACVDRDGHLQWTKRLPSVAETNPLGLAAGGVAVGLRGGWVARLGPDGSLVWHVQAPGGQWIPRLAEAPGGGVVGLRIAEGTPGPEWTLTDGVSAVAFGLTATGQQAWAVRLEGSVFSAPACSAAGGTYVCQWVDLQSARELTSAGREHSGAYGRLNCIDGAGHLVWQALAEVPGVFGTAPAAAEYISAYLPPPLPLAEGRVAYAEGLLGGGPALGVYSRVGEQESQIALDGKVVGLCEGSGCVGVACSGVEVPEGGSADEVVLVGSDWRPLARCAGGFLWDVRAPVCVDGVGAVALAGGNVVLAMSPADGGVVARSPDGPWLWWGKRWYIDGIAPAGPGRVVALLGEAGKADGEHRLACLELSVRASSVGPASE